MRYHGSVDLTVGEGGKEVRDLNGIKGTMRRPDDGFFSSPYIRLSRHRDSKQNLVFAYN
jgi:hypothetical protein